MRYVTKTGILIPMLTSVIAIAPGGFAQSPLLSVAVVGESSEPLLYQAVAARLSMENLTNESVSLNMGPNKVGFFSLTATLPTGTVVEISADDVLRAEGFGPKQVGQRTVINDSIAEIGQVTIKPGEIYTRRLLLSKWIDFSTPGRYRVVFRPRANFQTPSGQTIVIGPVSFDIQVAPENTARLRRLLADLSEQALGNGPYENRIQAAEDLSFVQSSEAVPFLRNILVKGDATLRRSAVGGLSRIGTPEAADALMGMLGQTDSEMRRVLISGLAVIASKTEDTQLRARIQEVLPTQ